MQFHPTRKRGTEFVSFGFSLKLLGKLAFCFLGQDAVAQVRVVRALYTWFLLLAYDGPFLMSINRFLLLIKTQLVFWRTSKWTCTSHHPLIGISWRCWYRLGVFSLPDWLDTDLIHVFARRNSSRRGTHRNKPCSRPVHLFMYSLIGAQFVYDNLLWNRF